MTLGNAGTALTAQAVVCNPVDLSYRLQRTGGFGGTAAFREGADPSVVWFRDRYLSFVSMSGGFWHSADLRQWEFVATPTLPVYDYAPDARVIDGHLVVCASRRDAPCAFYRTADPFAGHWEIIQGTLAFWDPNLFQDTDGRVYLYEGCSSERPIHGVELDRLTFAPVGVPKPLISADTHSHGWERPGEDWDLRKLQRSDAMREVLGERPFVEGAWMTRKDGRYYLQYAAPGTEMNTYSDGYYVGDSPLGPFRYGPNSPFSSKPGGFITGSGHGSTFRDRHGNWWHAATMRISRNHMFERRIGLFPAGIDDDGLLFCNQEFADYPIPLPDGRVSPWSLTGQWMLLSLHQPACASSAEPAHPAERAVDEDVRTWWTPGTAAPGEWLTVELPEGATVHHVQVNTAEAGAGLPLGTGEGRGTPLGRRLLDPGDVAAPFLLEASADGKSWQTLRDARRDGRSHELITLASPRRLRALRITTGASPMGVPQSVSGIRAFGIGAGRPPSSVAAYAVRVGPLDGHVQWAPSPGADGYTVRYGIAPDKLYSCWQLRPTQLDLRSLNADRNYWVAVDAFNANGVTRGEVTPLR